MISPETGQLNEESSPTTNPDISFDKGDEGESETTQMPEMKKLKEVLEDIKKGKNEKEAGREFIKIISVFHKGERTYVSHKNNPNKVKYYLKLVKIGNDKVDEILQRSGGNIKLKDDTKFTFALYDEGGMLLNNSNNLVKKFGDLKCRIWRVPDNKPKNGDNYVELNGDITKIEDEKEFNNLYCNDFRECEEIYKKAITPRSEAARNFNDRKENGDRKQGTSSKKKSPQPIAPELKIKQKKYPPRVNPDLLNPKKTQQERDIEEYLKSRPQEEERDYQRLITEREQYEGLLKLALEQKSRGETPSFPIEEYERDIKHINSEIERKFIRPARWAREDYKGSVDYYRKEILLLEKEIKLKGNDPQNTKEKDALSKKKKRLEDKLISLQKTKKFLKTPVLKQISGVVGWLYNKVKRLGRRYPGTTLVVGALGGGIGGFVIGGPIGSVVLGGPPLFTSVRELWYRVKNNEKDIIGPAWLNK